MFFFAYQVGQSQNSNFVDTIFVTNNLTTKLFFKDTIKNNDDIGNRLMFHASKKGNQYLLFADKKLKDESRISNLYIELPTGHYYEFILAYRKAVSKTIYQFTYDQATGINKLNRTKILEEVEDKGDKPVITKIKTQEDLEKEETSKELNEYAENCDIILQKKDGFSGIGEGHSGMTWWLNSIYTKDDKIYIRVTAKNSTNYTYDIARIRFAVSNKRKATKNTAVADRPIEYIYPTKLTKRIEGKSENSFVFVFDKFTIARKKFLYVDLWEKQPGERDLSFKISSKVLLKGKSLH